METLRLGLVEGGGPESFDGIAAVAFDRDGTIFVGNGGSATVRAFDSAGTFLLEFGGRGEGPAEVQAIGGLSVIGDTVLVTDLPRGNKALLFRRDGTFLRSVRILGEDGISVIPILPAEGGWLAWVQPPWSPPVGVAEGDSVVRFMETRVVGLGSDSVGPVVHRVPLPVLYGGSGQADRGLFSGVWSSDYDGPGRLFLVQPGGYQIDIHDPGGELRTSVRRQVPLRPIRDEDVALLRDRLAEIVDTIQRGPYPIAPAARAQQQERIQELLEHRARLPRPAFASRLGMILVADDGAFWVEHRDTALVVEAEARAWLGSVEGPPPAATEWGVFDRTAQYQGAVDLPARFRPMDVLGTTVVGVFTDDLDVEQVVRFEARPAG